LFVDSSINRSKVVSESLAKETDYFAKSKIYMMHGKVQNALENLENAFLQKNIYSYFYLYFYISGIIGNNEIIPHDKILEENLLNLMKENLSSIEKDANENKNLDAISILGHLNFKGLIYEKNNRKAKEVLSVGAALNCPFCLNLLAVVYDNERNSVCVGLYLKALNLMFLHAKINYAFIVKCGVYVKQNVKLFVEIMEGLADKIFDFYLAQFHLANYYLEEKNDYNKAMIYYAKAAKNMHIPSQKKLLDILNDSYKNYLPKDYYY